LNLLHGLNSLMQHIFMLEIKDLIVSYGRRSILKNIRLELEYGEKVAIIGPNGSGKSTLIKAVLGIAPISGGYVKILM